MKIRLKILGVLMAAISFSACTKEEEPYYGYGVSEMPKGSYSFNGVFTLNGEEVTNYSAGIFLKDTIFGCSFGIYQLREDNRFYEIKSFSNRMYLKDTASFVKDTFFIPYPEQIPNMSLTLVDGDALSCSWEHTDSGWCYAEQKDSTSYLVDLRGLIVTEGCGRPGGEEDTIAVEIKGVFTKRL